MTTPPDPRPPPLCYQALRGQVSREELSLSLVPLHLGNLERLLGQHGGLWCSALPTHRHSLTTHWGHALDDTHPMFSRSTADSPQLLPVACARCTYYGHTHCGRFTGSFSLADVRVADLCLHLFAPSLPGCLEDFPLLRGLVTRVKARPRIAAYLASERYAGTGTCFLASLRPFASLLPCFLLLHCFPASLLLFYNVLTHQSPYSQVRQHRQVLSTRLSL